MGRRPRAPHSSPFPSLFYLFSIFRIMEDEFIVAVEDFDEALREGSAAEGLRSLQSYDLSSAPGEALATLVTTFTTHLSANEAIFSARTLAQLDELRAALAGLLGAHPPLAARLQASWQRYLGAELLNAGDRDVEEHLQRLRALRQCLPDAVAGAAAALLTDFDVSNDSVQRSIVRASLFATLLFENDPRLETELEKLVEAVTVPCRHGATPLGVATIMQGAFEAALDVAQSSELNRSLSVMEPAAQTLFWGRAWSLLSVLRRAPPLAGDVWWGAHASAVLQLAEAVAQHGRGHPALDAAAALLCCPDAAAACLHTLLARAGEGAKGAQAAFQTAKMLLQDHPSAFVSACCTVLAPETNAALILRVQALQSVRVAVARGAAAAAAAGEEGDPLLQGPALSSIIFALKRDPSVRLRRKGMDLLRLLCERPPAGASAVIAATAAQRCFDADADVRRAAYGCLDVAPMPGDIPPVQWRRVIEEGLAAGAAGAPDAGSKQARESAGAAKRLLEKYLQGEGGALDRLEELLLAGGGGGGGGQTVSPEFLGALSSILNDGDLEAGTHGAHAAG